MKGLVKGAYASKLKTYDPVRKLEERMCILYQKFLKRNDEGHVSSHPMIRPSDLEVIYQTDEMLK